MARNAADMTAEFDERYRIGGEPVMRRIELRVIGADYGATSYTTKTQAARLGALLQLGPGVTMLDIGSGAGWPAIYLARSTGCRAVLTDRPLEGLRAAARRVNVECVDGRVVAASGDALPFGDGRFDVVTSSDVLC
jgi:ubiquinone/menaquinone biosynthesis C-methylase UbiE